MLQQLSPDDVAIDGVSGKNAAKAGPPKGVQHRVACEDGGQPFAGHERVEQPYEQHYTREYGQQVGELIGRPPKRVNEGGPVDPGPFEPRLNLSFPSGSQFALPVLLPCPGCSGTETGRDIYATCR